MTLNRTPPRQTHQSQSMTTNAPGDSHWYAATNVRIASGTVWTMPVPYWRDVRGHLAGFLTVNIDSFNVGTGSAQVRTETAVVKSNVPGAWTTLAEFDLTPSSPTTGMQSMRLGATMPGGIHTPLLGWLRLSIFADDDDVTISFHTMLVLKQPVAFRAMDWYSGQMSLGANDSFTLPLDLAADTSKFMNAYMAAQFDPVPDVYFEPVLVQLETTPALRPAAWVDIGGAQVPDGADTTVVLHSMRTVTHMIPSGIMRFTVINGAESPAIQGFLQTWLLLKQS